MTTLLLALMGCPAEPEDSEKGETGIDDTETTETDSETTESGTDTETDSTVPCTVAVSEVSPEDGDTEVYYRGELVVSFDGDASAASFSLVDGAGAAIEPEVSWSEGNVQATLVAELEASTDYTLTVSICGADTAVGFTTSALGTPLTEDPAQLVGRVYAFALADATFTDPAVLEAFDDAFLTAPLLFEVVAADAASITLLGALGGITDDGEYVQITDEEEWAFPAADFADAPTFVASTDLITIQYDGVDIPIENFALGGTFQADASSIEMGFTTGLVDTKDIGPLMSLPDEDYAVCDYAATFGVYCTACSDGEETCLSIVGEEISAIYQECMDIVSGDETPRDCDTTG